MLPPQLKFQQHSGFLSWMIFVELQARKSGRVAYTSSAYLGCLATHAKFNTMAAEQTAEFKNAAEESKKLKQKPNQNEMLEVCPDSLDNPCEFLFMSMQLYGLFKQGSQDPPIEQSKAPGMIDFVVRMLNPTIR